jgi:Flavodoxin reductases (ferredoxin-NADPH reductases) family 1
MGFLQDNLIPFFRQREIVFRESRREADDVVSFLFDKPDDLTWKAGQYGLFTITHRKIKNATKPFSVSSAPAENVIRITTIVKDNPSEFKRALLELKPGMKVTMRGPVGPFYLKDKAPVLLVAGGIGITPIRSMLRQIELEGSGDGRRIRLLYMDGDRRFVFRDELDRIAAHAGAAVDYLESRDGLSRELDRLADAYRTNGRIMIAGPQSMANALAAELRSRKIPKPNVVKDAFFGY